MTNEQRANAAAAALDTAYTVDDAGLIDLLTDLMHFADFWGLDFDQALKTAKHHHQTEKGETC